MHKRIVTAAILLAACVGLSVTAQAGGKRDDWVCWTGKDGATDCADLPEPYRVRDIPGKPHRHADRRHCKHCAVDFRLSHRNIDSFDNYVDTRNMRAYHGATLYGWKNRRIND